MKTGYILMDFDVNSNRFLKLSEFIKSVNSGSNLKKVLEKEIL